MRFLAIACCLVTVSAAPADPWVRVRSANFELFTTAGERSARDLVRYLEQVRSFFLQAFDLTGHEGHPVRVISFRSDKEYKPYRPSELADAFFQPGADHDYIVMKYSAGDLYSTAVHEYIHLLLRQTRMEIPRWLSEGLAELYSNLQPLDAQIVVGQPIPGRLQALAREHWIDLPVLLAPGLLPREKDRAAMFYAESWALLHMLSLDDRYSPGLRSLFGALQNDGAGAAFEKAYGKRLESVQKDLREYVRADAVHTAVFDVRLPDSVDTPRVDANAGLGARLALAEMLSNDGKTLARAAAAYQGLARDYENRWEVEQGWGEFAMRERKSAEAAQHFARAAGLGCDDGHMYLQYARLLNLTHRPAEALENLKVALRLEPALDDAHFEMAVALVHAGRDRDAVAQFHSIRKLDAQHSYRYFYNLALAHARLGDTDQARRLIEKARPQTRNPEELTALDRLLRTLP